MVAAGGLVFFKFMFLPGSMKNIVTSELQNVLHRPVQIGDINVLIYQGIRIKGLKVLEKPGYPDSDFLSADYLLAKYKWRALLQKRLELSELRFVAAHVHLTRL